jgi:hypothetical protein
LSIIIVLKFDKVVICMVVVGYIVYHYWVFFQFAYNVLSFSLEMENNAHLETRGHLISSCLCKKHMSSFVCSHSFAHKKNHCLRVFSNRHPFQVLSSIYWLGLGHMSVILLDIDLRI